jgi:hypothetical protein
METQKKETLEERIEKLAVQFKEEMLMKAKNLLDLNNEDAVTLDLIESFWRESRKNSDKLILSFYNDITNEEIQKAQVSKKKLNCLAMATR